ncbi:MAG: hypothetical protein IK990_09115 [Ruminiclostridium sp.]|nr:hypothetical protein [Ruminiclostridium sp.]
MNNKLIPIHNEQMSNEQIDKLIFSSKQKAEIVQKPRSFKRNKIIVTIAAAICLSVIGLGAFVVSGTIPVAANEDEYPDHRILRNSLNIGRYYLNGDLSESYVEVFEDGTLQWKNPVFASQLREININQSKSLGINSPLTDEQETAIIEEAEKAVAVHKYTVVYWKFIDTTMVMLDWDESDNIGGYGYDYIDRNTISIGYGGTTFTFEYVT